MLILNRKAGESITIGDNINIKILGRTHGEIRIGIEAPKHIRILRDELLNQNKTTYPTYRTNHENTNT